MFSFSVVLSKRPISSSSLSHPPSTSKLSSPAALSLTTFHRHCTTTSQQDKKPEGSTEETAAASEQEQKLVAEVEELKAKNADIMDKYRRSLAESDNMRKRLTKQIEDAKVFGIQGFVKDLLEVSDVLNKAVNGVPEEALASESQYLRDMHQGLQLTESQLLQVYKRHGLEQENPLGQKFDPNKHEALFQIPAPDKDPNVVLDVQKVGYLLHGRTIRPALVGVSKK